MIYRIFFRIYVVVVYCLVLGMHDISVMLDVVLYYQYRLILDIYLCMLIYLLLFYI